jgi:membrane-associated phospholipid phosphatase
MHTIPPMRIHNIAFTVYAVGLMAFPLRSQQPPDPQADNPPSQQDTNAQEFQDSRDRVLYSTETEHFKPLTRKLAQNILMDQKEMWTSPFHIRNVEDAVPWILVAGGTAALIASDDWSARQLPNTVDQVSISHDVSQLGAGYTVLPITAGLYIGGAFAHNEKARETGILSGEAILDSLIVAEVFKVTMRRQRPLDGDGNGKFFQGGSSFPSGHATESWALASVVAHEYNSNILYPIAAYGLASLVSFSRLSGQNHFPSDVFAGSALGWFTGRYVFKTHVDHSIHRRPESKLSSLRPRVMPQLDGITRGVVLAWGQ